MTTQPTQPTSHILSFTEQRRCEWIFVDLPSIPVGVSPRLLELQSHRHEAHLEGWGAVDGMGEGWKLRKVGVVFFVSGVDVILIRTGFVFGYL